MPCRIGTDSDIAIANYGSSNAARFKQVYREGLGLRYGRAMQTIAGAHYNWSLPEDFWLALREVCPAEGSLQDTIDHEQIYDYSSVWIRKNQFAQGNLPLAHPNLPLNAKRVAVRHRFPIFELSG